MQPGADEGQALQEVLSRAVEEKIPLEIIGGGSKRFYGGRAHGEPFPVAGHRGVVDYEPTELVVTARAGTPLREIEALLEAHGQMLAFEPPHLGETATLGGAIACGLSGPRRPYAGAARDFVLGVEYLNGKGERLHCGGRVMKNVAGYDISRLMVGALGTLGVLLEVSLKVVPRPARELTVVLQTTAQDAIEQMNRWAGRPLPLSAACYADDQLYVRLSGTERGVQAARRLIGGDELPSGDRFWRDLREQRLAFFAGDAPLWRVSVPPAAPPASLAGAWLLDWGGAQRWLRGEQPEAAVREATAAVGGHATLFRGGDRSGEVFHPLASGLLLLHRRLKQAFDPHGLLNPDRLCTPASPAGGARE